MLVHDRPLPAYLVQSGGETDFELGVASALLHSTTADQGSGKRHVITRGHVQLAEIKDARAAKPVEELLPGLSVSVDALQLGRGGNIEHEHVRRMVRDDTVQIAGPYCLRPTLEQ